MTKDKASKIGRGSAVCECGAERQTMHHLLWMCPFSPPSPPCLARHSTLPPYRACALLLPKGADNREIAEWKRACARACAILTQNRRNPREPVEPQQSRDLKGHAPCTSVDGLYVFCATCFISRRSRDLMWLRTKPCSRAQHVPINLGESCVIKGHDATLVMKTWKRASQRPAWRCTKCHQERWATSTFDGECEET